MLFPSRSVYSQQKGPHGKLEQIVKRHLQSPYLQPITERSRTSFQKIEQLRLESGLRRLILDAGCGTGESTLQLAEQFPDAFVLGIDKSLHRLRRHGISASNNLTRYDNAVLARIDCVDCWRLALDAGWHLDHHLLLYPNPWPKPQHLMRRWHAHPVFQALTRLGGLLELRTNWQIYADEFSQALGLICGDIVPIQACSNIDNEPLSPFERKYQQSGQALYRCIVDLDP